MPEVRRITDRRSLSGSLNVTAGSGIWDSEGGATVYIKFVDQFIHIINNKGRLNGLKGSTIMKNIESLFKYQSSIYNVQSNSDVNHRGMKIRRNNKKFPSINAINSKTSPYGSKNILRYYHYQSDPKLGSGIVTMKRITCNCHAFKTILSLSYHSKIKELFIRLDMAQYIIVIIIKLLVVTITEL